MTIVDLTIALEWRQREKLYSVTLTDIFDLKC